MNIRIQDFPLPDGLQIRFSLPQATEVKLTVYNLLGKQVQTLVDEYRKAGRHAVTFSARNLTSGMYIYQLKTENYSKSRKMLLLK